MNDINLLNLFIIIIFALILSHFSTMIIDRVLFAPPPGPPMPIGPKPVLANLFAELDLLIDMEILGVLEIPMAVKEIPLITDFKEIQLEIIHNVVESLSQNFIATWNAAGVKKAYISTYVTRRTHGKLIEFMQQHNYALK